MHLQLKILVISSTTSAQLFVRGHGIFDGIKGNAEAVCLVTSTWIANVATARPSISDMLHRKQPYACSARGKLTCTISYCFSCIAIKP